MNTLRCDIFCEVVDNFGDIGVCWRAARQLAREHGLVVRLWVDDLVSFRRLAPSLDTTLAAQDLDGVHVHRWDATAGLAVPADIVIDAFGCGLPRHYLETMAAQTRKPAWINLEYLSAEDWVEGCHALPSPHPQLPLTRHFFFPGFTARTGGLLREAGLTDDLRAFRADAAAQRAFWADTAKTLPAQDALKISLFSYESPALPALLDAWAGGTCDIFCAVPEGRILPQVRAWAGNTLEHGRLRLAILPFLPHTAYDRLLAACDLNFVRGEDSFVRAQWAAHPLIWHIYQQEGDAHRPKLEAFLARYTATLPTDAAGALRDFWQAWDHGEGAGAAWPALLEVMPALQEHAQRWAGLLTRQQDLIANLLIFCKDLLQYPAL